MINRIRKNKRIPFDNFFSSTTVFPYIGKLNKKGKNYGLRRKGLKEFYYFAKSIERRREYNRQIILCEASASFG